jgi:hypothetical protein
VERSLSSGNTRVERSLSSGITWVERTLCSGNTRVERSLSSGNTRVERSLSSGNKKDLSRSQGKKHPFGVLIVIFTLKFDANLGYFRSTRAHVEVGLVLLVNLSF